VILYLRVGKPTQLTTVSTRVSQVLLGEPNQKSTRIIICKKISNQPEPNPWWADLIRGILTYFDSSNLLSFFLTPLLLQNSLFLHYFFYLYYILKIIFIKSNVRLIVFTM